MTKSLLSEHVGAETTTQEPPYARGFKFSGVYMITHVMTGQVYVGSTKDWYARHRQHHTDLARGVHANPRLQRAFVQDNELEMEVFLTPTPEEAIRLEQAYLNKHHGEANLMNVCSDVRGALGVKRRPETCEAISRAKTGRPLSEEHRQSLRGPRPNFKPSEEHLQKVRDVIAGVPRSEETREKIRQAQLAHQSRLREAKSVTP